MKSILKVVVMALIVVLALGTCSLFVACDKTPKVETFTITVSECDETQGTVTILPKKDNYESGEEVTVTLVAKDGFAVKEFILDNNDLTRQLDVNKSYKKKIYKNWDIKVRWQDYDDSLRWTVTAPEKEGGSVTVSPAKDEYLNFETVQIIVEVEEGYEIDELMINGESYWAGLYNETTHVFDGKVAFDVSADTTVEATFNKIDYSVVGDLYVDSFYNKIVNSKGIVLVDIWATWCGYCMGFAPGYEDFAKIEGNNVRLFKFDAGYNDTDDVVKSYGTAKAIYEAANKEWLAQKKDTGSRYYAELQNYRELEYHGPDGYRYEDRPKAFAVREFGNGIEMPVLVMYVDGRKVAQSKVNYKTDIAAFIEENKNK